MIQVAGVGPGEAILREEEEQLIAAAIEACAGKEDGTAKRPGAVVERVRRRIALCRLTGVALLAPQEFVAVELLIAFVVRRRPMEGVRAAARDDGDRG